MFSLLVGMNRIFLEQPFTLTIKNLKEVSLLSSYTLGTDPTRDLENSLQKHSAKINVESSSETNKNC